MNHPHPAVAVSGFCWTRARRPAAPKNPHGPHQIPPRTGSHPAAIPTNGAAATRKGGSRALHRVEEGRGQGTPRAAAKTGPPGRPRSGSSRTADKDRAGRRPQGPPPQGRPPKARRRPCQLLRQRIVNDTGLAAGPREVPAQPADGGRTPPSGRRRKLAAATAAPAGARGPGPKARPLPGLPGRPVNRPVEYRTASKGRRADQLAEMASDSYGGSASGARARRT